MQLSVSEEDFLFLVNRKLTLHENSWKLWILPHLLKKSLMEKFIFCAV